MAVQVQQPTRRRRDIFDVVLGGLQAASAYTNIRKANAEIDAIPEVRARLEEKEAKAAAKEFRKETADIKKEKLSAESGLRKEWLGNQQTKTTQSVASSAGKVAAVATTKPTAAGDVSLVFSYMKLLDPTSVVRESEQELARNAAGLPERLKTGVNQLLRGETLSPSQRQDFARRAVQLYEVHWEKQKSFNKAFEDIAKRSDLNSKNIVLDVGLNPDAFNKVINNYLRKSRVTGGAAPRFGEGAAKVKQIPTQTQETFNPDQFLQE